MPSILIAFHFFHIIEVTFNLNGVAKCMLSKLLPDLLSSRAQQCYAHLNLDEVTDYDKVKEAILASYRLNARTYLSKLKSVRRTGGDTYTIFLNKVEELCKFYLETQKIDTFAALVNEVVNLQFLE